MPEEDDRSVGIFADRSGWRLGFALAWCALLALTVAASLLLGGLSTSRGVFLAGIAAGGPPDLSSDKYKYFGEIYGHDAWRLR